MSFSKAEDSIYKAVIRKDLAVVNGFLERGETIPDFLYLQVTNHDHLAILQFMLNIQPEKKENATRLAVGQGAIQCTLFLLKTASLQYCTELAQIKPRRNQKDMTEVMQTAILEKTPTTEPSSSCVV